MFPDVQGLRKTVSLLKIPKQGYRCYLDSKSGKLSLDEEKLG